MAKKTAFYSIHQNSGAKLIDFGGFDMPVQYAGIRQEHTAVREAVGVFDVSHMGEFFVVGPEAAQLIQHVTINDVSKINIGQAQYSAMCYEDGGIVDDLLVYKLAEDKFMLVVNASNIEKDFAWIAQYATKFDCELRNESDHWHLLAVQGPKAPALLNRLTEDAYDPSSIKFYTFDYAEVAGMGPVILSATGYTGEKGFEIYFTSEMADPEKMWEALMKHGEDMGIQPCGLGARDTLRLEKGYALYGNDIDATTNPLQARMGWLTKLEKGDFVGKEALLKAKDSNTQRLVGFKVTDGKGIARKDFPVLDPDSQETIGRVTSGTQSITTSDVIGMAYVNNDFAALGTKILLQIRKKTVQAEVVKIPFC